MNLTSHSLTSSPQERDSGAAPAQHGAARGVRVRDAQRLARLRPGACAARREAAPRRGGEQPEAVRAETVRCY